LEGVVGDAFFEGMEMEDAYEGVAALDVAVEEGEGFLGDVGFNPEGDAAEFYGEGIFIHAVEAMGDDVAHGLAEFFWGGGGVGVSDLGEFLAQVAGSR
jgi:hypothetical protein